MPFASSRVQLVRWLALALTALALIACAGGSGSPPVPAPILAVGDHWTYKITDNLRRGIVSTLDAEVSSINGGVATVRLALTNAQGATIMWDQEMDANGGLLVGVLKPSEVMTRRYPKPIELYDFPLTTGTTWRQVIDTTSPETGLDAQILVYGRVLGPSQVTVPAGTFGAVYVYRILQLDDEQFWRTRTERRDGVWYTPDNKAPARETRDAQYIERSGPDVPVVRTESTVRELISFRPGKG
jgi:hypothetical protein